jgi:hypothetical protein
LRGSRTAGRDPALPRGAVGAPLDGRRAAEPQPAATTAAQPGLSCSARLLVHLLRPYPAGPPGSLRYSRLGPGLRRDMSGSAPGLFVCRGCRLHVKLRPVDLLPAARRTPPDGRSMPARATGSPPARLAPATRRTGAYRGGTSTCWRRAARRLRPYGSAEVRFTTHHA